MERKYYKIRPGKDCVAGSLKWLFPDTVKVQDEYRWNKDVLKYQISFFRDGQLSFFYFYEENGSCYEFFSNMPIGSFVKEGTYRGCLASNKYGVIATDYGGRGSDFGAISLPLAASVFLAEVKPYVQHRELIAKRIREIFGQRETSVSRKKEAENKAANDSIRKEESAEKLLDDLINSQK